MALRLSTSLWGLPLVAALASGCSAIVDTDADQCAATSDCIALGGEFSSSVCSRDKVCVPLLTKDCLHIAPQDVAIEDDTIIVGFMSPLVGDFASNGIPQWEGVQLALSELNKDTNGLPQPDGSTRPVAVIGCHDFDDPIGVANHLINDVQVPGILGPAFSGITIDVATEVAIPGNALLLLSSATSPAITNLSDKGLVWRTCPTDALQAVPMAKLVADMEQKVRTDLALPTSTPIRVAMAVKGDAYGTGLADAITPILKFNGKSAVQNGDNFSRRDYDDPAANPSFDFLPLVSELVAFTPHIVLPLGTNEGITKVMLELEAKWPQGTPRPIYIFPDGGRLDELLAATTSNASLRIRVLGTVPGRPTTKYQEWASRFSAIFGHVPLTFADTAYDSAYLLAYSLVSLQGAPPSGPSLAEGLKKTIDGPVFSPASDLGGAFAALLQGGTIDYDGISGPLDFDVNTGEAPADVDIWCVSTTGTKFESSGQFYSAASGAVEGTRGATCPSELQSQ